MVSPLAGSPAAAPAALACGARRRPSLVAAAALALAAVVCGCERSDRAAPPPTASAEAAAVGKGGAGGISAEGAGVSTPALAPLVAESWLITLPAEGFEDVFTSVPLGAAEPRPVVVALHGIQDRAEWACGEWRGAAGPHPFV